MRPRLILNCLLLILLLPFHPLQAEQTSSDPAAVINGQAISFAELDRATEEEQSYIRSRYQGLELEAKIRTLKLDTLNVMIDRDLIIQAFYKSGGKIPDGYIDSRLEAIVKEEYSGDRTAFNLTLQDRGISLTSYRQEITDIYIVAYMRTQNVSDKISKTVTDESGQSSQE